MEDVRKEVEKYLLYEFGRIRKMDDGETKWKTLEKVTSLYDAYNKDWKDEWDVQLQQERRDFDAEKFEFEKAKFEFEKSKSENEFLNAALDRRVRFFEKLLGIADTGIRVTSMFAETRADMIFQNEGKINKGVERIMTRHKLLGK